MSIFISFSFQDHNKYEDICYAFDHDGIDYWKTDEIAAGQSLRDKLQNAIRGCSVCVLIATRNSLESGWCQAEIGAFWGAGKPVIVFLADDKLTEDSLPKQFKGDKFATTIREVVNAIKAHLSESPDTHVVMQPELICEFRVDKARRPLRSKDDKSAFEVRAWITNAPADTFCVVYQLDEYHEEQQFNTIGPDEPGFELYFDCPYDFEIRATLWRSGQNGIGLRARVVEALVRRYENHTAPYVAKAIAAIRENIS
jgi:hypothetical protein